MVNVRQTSMSMLARIDCFVMATSRTPGTLAVGSGEVEFCVIGSGVSEGLFGWSLVPE